MQHITGLNVAETTIRPADEPAADEPQEIATLSAQHLLAFTRQSAVDAEPELVVHDGEIEFVVNHEIGRVELAIMGLKRLGDAAYAHATLLEQRASRSRAYS